VAGQLQAASVPIAKAASTLQPRLGQTDEQTRYRLMPPYGGGGGIIGAVVNNMGTFLNTYCKTDRTIYNDAFDNDHISLAATHSSPCPA